MLSDISEGREPSPCHLSDTRLAVLVLQVVTMRTLVIVILLTAWGTACTAVVDRAIADPPRDEDDGGSGTGGVADEE